MILEAEREFWDQAAERARVGAAAEATLVPLDRFSSHILAAAGPLAGLDVLELGCGDGQLTVRLADCGASSVTAADVSSGQLARARALVDAHFPGASVKFVAAAAEDTGLASRSFDLVIGRFVLHHLDVPRAVPEIARLLRPGGRAVFYENHDRNPLLAMSRRHLAGRYGIARMGTSTERPLGKHDFALLRQHFRSVERRYPEFVCFQMLASRALRYCGYRALTRLDGLIWRTVPGLRPLSWHVLVVASGPRGGADP